MLITNCWCGSSIFIKSVENAIELNTCANCSTPHQALDMNENDLLEFYQREYHTSHQKEIGLQTYQDRYEHDCGVARVRLLEYKNILDSGSRILDVGCSNGSFVDTCNNSGFSCEGIDLIEGLKDKPNYHFGELTKANLPESHFDVITMHDVLEHLVGPVCYLKECLRIIKPTGCLVVDYPDYHVEAGLHHWRKIQHLWYHNVHQLNNMLSFSGFHVEEVRKPIKSKLVLYCKPKG